MEIPHVFEETHCFYVEFLAAERGPSKSGYNAGRGVLIKPLIRELKRVMGSSIVIRSSRFFPEGDPGQWPSLGFYNSSRARRSMNIREIL